MAGPDVILVHRLLKNGVGGGAYVLFTEAALRWLAMDPVARDVRPVTERYPTFGELPCFVLALDAPTGPRAAICDVATARYPWRRRARVSLKDGARRCENIAGASPPPRASANLTARPIRYFHTLSVFITTPTYLTVPPT